MSATQKAEKAITLTSTQTRFLRGQAHELRAMLQRAIKPSPTGRAPTDPDDLVRQIKRFRMQGYGIELNEANEHAGCVAAPVTDVSGKCVAAISIVAPEQRLQRRQREVLVSAVRRAAGKLSRRLGAA